MRLLTNPALQQQLKDRLRGPMRRALELAGVPAGVRPHLQDRLVKSAIARLRAVPRGGRMWNGTEVLWPRAGVASIGVLDIPAPGPGEVLVKAEFTAVSPGTERAFLSVLPGVSAVFPSRPGYSGSGVVVEVGRGVQHLTPGDRVGCTEMHHASLALLPQDRVFRLADSVAFDAAAFLQLLIIAQYGVRKACIEPGQDVVVIGAGLIGQLVLQLARAAGAASVSVAAASTAKRDLTLAHGADRFVEPSALDGDVEALRCPIVIEAAGTPAAISLATQLAATHARVVLLGSTRGINRSVDFDELIRRKALSLIGAHIGTLAQEPSNGTPSYRDEAESVLSLLAEGRVQLDGLISERVNPLEAPLFYRRLCLGQGQIVGTVFAWNQLDEARRSRRSFALIPPTDLMRHGRPFDQNDGPPSVIVRDTPRSPLHDAVGILPEPRGPLRFGLIGCGGMGARHAQALRDAPNTALVATMDTDARLARELAQGAFSTTRLEALLQRPEIDAIIIVTPNHLHEAIGIAAARAGKHVVVEKPMAANLAAADALLRGCRDAGVALSVGYSFRYAPEVRLARRLVAAGILGRLLTVQLSCYFDRSPSYWGSGVTGRALSSWRGAIDTAGGGVFIMNMSHQLDQIRYVVGKDITRVTSVVGTLDSPPGVEVEDTASICCEFEGGAIGNFFGTSSARGLENLTEIRLTGDAGSIILDTPPRFFTLRSLDGFTPGRWHSFGTLPKVDVHASYIAWFADAVLRGERPEVTGEDGRAIQAWAEAAYRSARLRQPVEVAELS